MSVLEGTIQIRKDTAANWTSANPTLLSGEWGLETDTGKIKMGTGATWNATPYAVSPRTEVISGGSITVGTFGGSGTNNDIRVAAVAYYIVGNGGYSASQTDFLDIALSSAGNQRYVGLFGTTSGTITKSEGTEAAIAAYPSTPANTCPIGYVLVSDASLGGAVDLSGYLLKADKATQSTVMAGTNDTTYLTPLANDRDLKLIARDAANSSSITGTTSETKIGNGLAIPAGSVSTGDEILLRSVVGQLAASGSATIRLYIHTLDQLSGATLLGIFSAVGSRVPISRHLNVESSTSTTYMFAAESLINDFTVVAGNNNSATKISTNINWSVTQYIITSFAPSTSGATSTRHTIEAFKY